MSDLDTLKKIIPPDQAVANKALARSLQQVKQIFNTDLATLAPVIATLETTRGLDLINALDTPVPPDVMAAFTNSLGTGTGTGNTITIMDMVGTAAGNTVVQDLPVVTNIVQDLANLGALDPLTGNGGSPGSSTNGVYTVMQYALAGDYTTTVEISPFDPGPPPSPAVYEYTITIPSPLPGAGTYGPYYNLFQTLDDCFGNLITIGNARIATIAANYSDMANVSNQAFSNIANQMAINANNLSKAQIDVGNLVSNIANANLAANSTSTVLSFATQLQTLGIDVAPGGSAEFIERVANLSNLTGQGVVASLREGRNIQRLNEVGIVLATQITGTTIPAVGTANLLPS
jgi:hypothetical protein